MLLLFLQGITIALLVISLYSEHHDMGRLLTPLEYANCRAVHDEGDKRVFVPDNHPHYVQKTVPDNGQSKSCY